MLLKRKQANNNIGMSIDQKFIEIVENNRDNEILDFLKSLDIKERRSLAPQVKKQAKKYFEFVQDGNTWRSLATDQQRSILQHSIFTCYDQKEFQRENPAYMIAREHLEQYLDWYCPPWLNSYINSFAENEWLPLGLDYFYLVELTERGIIEPVPGLVARILTPVIFETTPRHKTRFVPEKLLIKPVTLQEHIWYLFQYETNVHSAERYLYGLDQKENPGWQKSIKMVCDEGKIDRQRLLKESLMAANRNFNKNLSGWFAALFNYLEPTKEEILSLQPELINLFSSAHSKVVSTALQSTKGIIEMPGFDQDGFLDHVPVLLASDTKAVITSTLQILEKLAKANPGKRKQVCHLAIGAFIHREESLQNRAAKLIQNYAGKDDEELKQKLKQYQGTLLSSTVTTLAGFIMDNAVASPEDSLQNLLEEELSPLREDNVLPQINTLDELVFLASQAFDNNESWHLDLLLDALLRFDQKIEGRDMIKFEPAIQRALKLYFHDIRSNQGYLDRLLGSFFLDFCLLQIARNQNEAASTLEIFKSFLYKIEENKKIWDEHGTKISFLEGWKIPDENHLYEPHEILLKEAGRMIRENKVMPVLSTPTHQPVWIDPSTLVMRIADYQSKEIKPIDMDLQIAISRCWLHNTSAAIALASDKLKGEWRNLVLFLFDKNVQPVGPYKMESAWMMAALTKSPGNAFALMGHLSYAGLPGPIFTGQHKWETTIEEYDADEYEWKDEKLYTKKVKRSRKAIVFLPEVKEKKPGLLKKLFPASNGTKHKRNENAAPLIFEYLRMKNQYLVIEDRDIRRILMLTPNHPEPLLAFVMQHFLNTPNLTSETDKRFLVALLGALHDVGLPTGEMAHLFIATCMICSDKTISGYAAELWMKGVSNRSINSHLIGEVLGRHELIEFAPLKRFTDLAGSTMYGISSQHNKALEIMITGLLGQLPPEPIKGLKKLLEIYADLLRINNSGIEDLKVRELMEAWKGNANIAKIIKSVS
ncbi:MAG TPA: DUF6493 family protein [Flavisolibacter sp.]